MEPQNSRPRSYPSPTIALAFSRREPAEQARFGHFRRDALARLGVHLT
jgi:hypothetical protein